MILEDYPWLQQVEVTEDHLQYCGRVGAEVQQALSWEAEVGEVARLQMATEEVEAGRLEMLPTAVQLLARKGEEAESVLKEEGVTLAEVAGKAQTVCDVE